MNGNLVLEERSERPLARGVLGEGRTWTSRKMAAATTTAAQADLEAEKRKMCSEI